MKSNQTDNKMRHKSIASVAAALGCGVVTLYSAKVFPGFPKKENGGYDADAVREFLFARRSDDTLTQREYDKMRAKMGAKPKEGEEIPVEQISELERVGALPPAGYDTWQIYKTAMEAQRQAVLLARDKGEVVEKSFVQSMNSRAVNRLCANLTRHFCSELPPLTQGCDAVVIEAKNREALNACFEEFRLELKGWTDEE